ncbi:unnamed protein product [Adineta ricciae]|uniref:G-protein coupled receptors family 1 profile domain-containing protein n=1 Tax=Adineta ricciae TaxID=249248 RepID=A0A815B9J6_ADIRI|nr:unnamed protein product [Adineta ricciae]CAF1269312.1 unnamed protein product [Adineta ricciae]
MNSLDPSQMTPYGIIIPLSLACIFVAFLIACAILTLIVCTKRLHTVTHLLIGNGSIALIFYCFVQSINYIHLAFISWETNDLLCRWRGFFGYMTVVATVYSYLIQAISRFFISILAIRHRWVKSFKTHLILISIHWSLVVLLPLPALLTEDIYHRPNALCWVPKDYTLHVAYTVIAYYLIPTIIIFILYIAIFCRVKRRKLNIFIRRRKARSNRDLDLLYNIMILFSIYILGALPIILFVLTKSDVLYSIGIISVSLALAVEKGVILIIDRDIRNTVRFYLQKTAAQVGPSIRSIS